MLFYVIADGNERTTVAYVPIEVSDDSRWADHISAGINFGSYNTLEAVREGEGIEAVPVLT
jgi:hypothetical protein